MSESMILSMVIGVGATALLDVWAQLMRLFGEPKPNWAPPGRWVAHLLRGRAVHQNIAEADPLPGEVAIGWTFHYLVGILFAAILLGVWGFGWARNPTFWPAAGFVDTEIGCFMKPEVGYATKAIWA
ncbi:DUF2938 family protein [Bosea sp. (in: a-proteobacteria)]|uniref:DUF2938 family protein n=1 Tax=Bosea sp. (in: a-proteobacteria) TaxID=1871050 RepID=UPI003B3AD820